MFSIPSPTARAEWQDVITGLRIGVVAAENPQLAVQRLQPFADFLEADLSVATEIVPFKSYTALIDAHADRRVDIAAHSATSYLAARAACGCIEAMAVPKSADGMTYFYGVAVTRREDRVTALADLNGRSVAFGAAGETATNRVPSAHLAAEGRSPGRFFAKTQRFENTGAAIGALMNREVDAVFTWSSLSGDLSGGYSRGPLRRLAAADKLNMADLDIAWRSKPIPHGPVAIRADLPNEVRMTMRALLLELHDRDPDAYAAMEQWHGRGFAPVEPALFTDLAILLGYTEPDKEETAVTGTDDGSAEGD